MAPARVPAVYECERSSCADGSDMVDMLRSRRGTVIERADEQGIVVSTPATLAIGYRVWLDPSKGFQPTRIHWFLNLGGKLITYLEQENTLEQGGTRCVGPCQVRGLALFAKQEIGNRPRAARTRSKSSP